MLFKLFVPASLALFAAAAPQTIIDQCNTGAVMCCTTTQDANNPVIGSLLSLLGIDAGNLTSSTGQVGLGCTPVNVGSGSAEGASCSQQPVCCDDNTFNGLVNLGCNSIFI